jgi:putative signal transducing protein
VRDQQAGPPDADEAVVTSLRWEEAWVVAGRLRSDGIAARIHPEMYSSAYGRALQPSADVIVPREQLDEAQKILADIEA